MTAVWTVGRLGAQTFPQLQTRLEVDVVVIGAGATGLATAYKLLEAGKRVAVVEALQVGAGSTGRSTGNLYSTLSQGLAPVREKWDDAVIREVVALRSLALDFIEDVFDHPSRDCHFVRRPLYLAIPDADAEQEQQLEAEHSAATAAGLSATLVDAAPELPFPVHKALRIDYQAQYNPLRYVQCLAHMVTEAGGLIFEASRVTDIDASAGTVKTEHGEVHAEAIVEATHTPKGVNLIQAEMECFQEYGVAARVPATAQLPEGIFWLQDGFHSLRSYSEAGERYVMVVGEKHATGHSDLGKGHYDKLCSYLQRHFKVDRFDYRWSAQQFKSADLLPYIGRSGHDNVFIGTGYAADGLTWGTVAATLISNLVLGRDSRGAALFSPRRFTPAKSAQNWLKENTTVAKHLAKDHFTSVGDGGLGDVAPGEGRLVHMHGEDLAVYRSADNQLSILSPVCPHMKCKVRWNGADSTWDCPCHGSRFAPDGGVLEGPALEPLQPRAQK